MGEKFTPSLHWSQLLWNSRGLVRNPIPYHHKWFETYGDTLRFRFINGTEVYLTRDPEFALHILKKNHKNYYKSDVTSENLGHYIGKGLLTLNGGEWKKDRRLLQPGFYKERIQKVFNEAIPKAVTSGLDDIPLGQQVDVKPYMNRLAFEVVTKALFDIEVAPERLEEIRHIIDAVQEHFVKEVREPQWNFWRYLIGQKRLALAQVSRMRAIMQELIQERQQSKLVHDDLLDLMLQSTYEDGSYMEADRVIDELIILIVAGHETTANALCYMFYELARNPNFMDAVQAELAEIGAASPYHQLGQMTYGKALVQETLRYYPPAWIIDRKALEADTVAGETLAPNSFVAISIYELHRNPTYWEQPERFDPKRFLKPPPPVYIPFGAGPRMCIGNHFALFEMLEVLRQLAVNYQLKVPNKEPEQLGKITLQARTMLLELNKRNE